MGRAVRGDFLEEVTRSSASGTGFRQAARRHAARGKRTGGNRYRSRRVCWVGRAQSGGEGFVWDTCGTYLTDVETLTYMEKECRGKNAGGRFCFQTVLPPVPPVGRLPQPKTKL